MTEDEEFALRRMIVLEGIFRIILLKRLESSVDSFNYNLHLRCTI
ncbi:hypothetical protein FHEFKHOI_01268 [Candidatus Methanoperedenaceae archaeon GB50]|nr:hypothetical protein AIOGIFDO_01258 [Candidatus Methanoperedenaceae archaeon GB37]CAD7772681.1 hypothetical protein FHEFKHOI_01268 [Candidatus Methanoperedenaceae archaeon GB50]CAD7778749.1 MAG: hypothetical protein KBONHNOK_01183 [Candidatus Methanoperedenaceae archaeon GB50]